MNKHEKNIACCFTGHRKIPQRKTEQIQERLRNEIVTAILRLFRMDTLFSMPEVLSVLTQWQHKQSLNLKLSILTLN